MKPPVRERNDSRQYDDLVDHWWRPGGAFAALHWLAAARSALIPLAVQPGEVLVDLGCGGGLMASHTAGYLHIGVDITESALMVAREHGLHPVRADASNIPLRDRTASVILAGEILEHVSDLPAVVAEICRVLRPGGTVVIDTINDSRRARFALVTIAEHLPGGPPPRIHDPRLFVAPQHLCELFAQNGVELAIWGIRPSVRDYAGFLVDRRRAVRMLMTKSLAVVYQGVGLKVQG